MMNVGALTWFDSFIKKLKKKTLDCINQMIYIDLCLDNLIAHAYIITTTTYELKSK